VPVTSAVNPGHVGVSFELAPWSLRVEAGASDYEINPQPSNFNSRRKRNGLFRGCDASVAEGDQDQGCTTWCSSVRLW
jgi:hypothetical protein